MIPAIETHRLVKHFGPVAAVEDLSLTVKEGEIYAFLGLNGAGKTTTIRMLLSMVRPDRGRIRIFDQEVRPGGRGPWSSVGYMVEIPHSYPELTVRENLQVAQRLHLTSDAQAIDEVLETMGLVRYADRRAGVLSLGNKQRLGLAKALLANPHLLVLDEPANGLDPAGIVEIREMLRSRAHEQGVTIFMSSHILSEVARLADRIGIIHQGRLVTELDASELEKHRRRKLVVDGRDRAGMRSHLSARGLALGLEDHGALSLADTDSLERPDEVARLLVEAGYPPTTLRIVEEDLESYFLRLVGAESGISS